MPLAIPAVSGGILFTPATSQQSIYEESARQKHMLGTKLDNGDGRVFRYAKAGDTTALVQAFMTQNGITSATYFTDIAQSAAAVAFQTKGSRDIRVLVTTGGIAAKTLGYEENGFSGGWLVYNKALPAVLGDTYLIEASKYYSETLMDLRLATPLRNQISGTTGEVTLTVSKFFGTLVRPVDACTAPMAGVPLIPVTKAYYYWSQVKGPCPLMVDTGLTVLIGGIVGAPLAAASTVAGACGPLLTVTTTQFGTAWGTAMSIATGDEPALVDLCLE